MPKFKFSIVDALKIAPLVVGTVKGVQEALKGQSGAEKKAAATEALDMGLGIYEIVADDTISPENKARAQTLLSRGIEAGVAVMKAEHELAAIAAELKAIRGTSTAAA